MSRACDEFMLLTDDREALAEVLVHRPGLEESALEAIGEALTAPPVVEPEVFDKLRADWTAVRTRAETAGDIAYFTDGYTDVMARAAALSAIEELPADMRRFPDRAAALLAARDGHGQWRRDAIKLIEAGRVMLADAFGDRPHLDAMPGARNRIARALSPLVRTLQGESKSASDDGAYILPCRDRVLPGDRIRCTVHARSGYGFSTDGEKLLIEGEVQDVRSHFLVSVRITACPGDGGPSPESAVLLPMRELLEFGCVRMLSENEETRARLEADVRREIAESEKSVARQLLERDRRRARAIDRGEDHDLHM